MSQLGYQPIFKGILPSDVPSRWRCIRQFVDFWCMPQDEPLTDRSQEESGLIETAKQLHNGDLSPSIRHWLSLSEEASRRQAPMIRDCLMLEPLEKHLQYPEAKEATIILMQAEGDLFWTVKNTDLAAADPPVDVYQAFDDDAQPFYVRYPSVSEFALAYLCTYNSFARLACERFTVHVKPDQLKEVQEWFEYKLVLNSHGGKKHRFLILLESENIVALVNNSNRIELSLFSDPNSMDMPTLLVDALDSKLKSREEFRKLYGR